MTEEAGAVESEYITKLRQSKSETQAKAKSQTDCVQEPNAGQRAAWQDKLTPLYNEFVQKYGDTGRGFLTEGAVQARQLTTRKPGPGDRTRSPGRELLTAPTMQDPAHDGTGQSMQLPSGAPLDGIVVAVEWTVRAAAVLGSLFALAIFLAVAWDIVGREVLGRSTTIAVDLSEQMMVPLVFLVVPYVAQIGGNVRLDLLTNRLRDRSHRLVIGTGHFLFLVFAGLIAWRGWSLTWDAIRFHSLTDTIGLPTWPFLAAIPVGGILLCLQLLVLFWRVLRGEAGDRPPVH